MFKRNKVQGKHAAHAKQSTPKEVQQKQEWEDEDYLDFDSVTESSDGDAVDFGTFDFQEEPTVADIPKIDVPAIEAHATKKINLPKIDPAKPANGKSVASIADPMATGRVDSGALAAQVEESFFAPQGFQWDGGAIAEPKKPANKKKIGIIVGAILGILLLVYLIGVGVFAGRFYPSTEINGTDISMKTIDEVASQIDKMGTEYKVAVKGQGLDFSIASADMGIKVDGKKVAQSAHDAVPSWGWPVYVFGHKDLAESMAAEYNAGGLKDIVNVEVEEWNKEATDPTNATMAYDEKTKQFKVAPEAVGTKLDPEAVLKEVDKAVISMSPTAKITEKQLLQPTVFSDDERLAKACETANGYIKADLKLKMDGIDAGEINADQISQWVVLNDKLEASFDEDKMDAWLIDFGNSLDTAGSQRTYTRPDGKEVTVEGGTYGWEIDSEALVPVVREAILNGTQGDIDVPVLVAGVYYNADGGPDWADYLDVDLSEQHARFITEAGDVIWESDVVTGRPDGEHDTPTGVWTLFNMESPATLKGDIQVATGQPEYETKVQFWMPFTYSGCGFHDATWQPAFGGSLYSQGLGSHGCVNLPYSAAEELYSKASIGLPVIVHW